jgi:hypothetical protein
MDPHFLDFGTSSIFRAEEQAKQEFSMKQVASRACPSKRLVAFQQTTCHYDRTLHNHSCENLKSYTFSSNVFEKRTSHYKKNQSRSQDTNTKYWVNYWLNLKLQTRQPAVATEMFLWLATTQTPRCKVRMQAVVYFIRSTNNWNSHKTKDSPLLCQRKFKKCIFCLGYSKGATVGAHGVKHNNGLLLDSVPRYLMDHFFLVGCIQMVTCK